MKRNRFAEDAAWVAFFACLLWVIALLLFSF